jgi:hypothetical protein
MPRIALLMLLPLAACASGDTSGSGGRVTMAGWHTAMGTAPTRVEFDAVVASCQDRAPAGTVAFDSCLTDLGLKRSE